MRARSQALASIVGLKRENADVPSTGVVAPQTGEIHILVIKDTKSSFGDSWRGVYDSIIHLRDR